MRNNYADNDAGAKTLVATSGTSMTIAADADQFHVIDWITISNQATGVLTIEYQDADGSNAVKVWDVTCGGNDIDHVIFGNGLYEENTPKNRKVVITKTSGMKVCVRFR